MHTSQYLLNNCSKQGIVLIHGGEGKKSKNVQSRCLGHLWSGKEEVDSLCAIYLTHKVCAGVEATGRVAIQKQERRAQLKMAR